MQVGIFLEIMSAETVSIADVKNLIELARDSEAEAMVLCQTSRSYQLDSAQVLPWAAGLNAIFGV
jgi:hypothetical protein